jgi:hypothetical protein
VFYSFYGALSPKSVNPWIREEDLPGRCIDSLGKSWGIVLSLTQTLPHGFSPKEWDAWWQLKCALQPRSVSKGDHGREMEKQCEERKEEARDGVFSPHRKGNSRAQKGI